jgi:V/A-type H+-transporting ATPase subunit I
MDPIDNAMTMLIFSCIFGVFHIFVGLGVRAVSLIRMGRAVDVIDRVVMWYALILGLAFLLAGDMLFTGASEIGKWMSIIGAGGIILVPVFTGKGVGKALGFWNLYGITNYLADILSYARLLALCLAGSVIAQVFNTLATFSGTSVIGVIIFIVIVVAAHIFNFLLSGLGAFVHAIRLQYVEFFGKFFEGKGTPFKPFMINTKYVKIIKEEN